MNEEQLQALGQRFGPRLLDGSTTRLQRGCVLEMLAAALDAVDPEQAILRSVRITGKDLAVGQGSIPLDSIGRVIVVGAGKAGAPMARAVERTLGGRISGGWINVKDGHTDHTDRIHLHEAGHPIPDERSVEGTGEIVELVSGLTDRDLVLCLISGGGSALLTLPHDDVPFHDLQATTSLLMRAGATINQLNTVRKHLDQIKGGGLARLASPARVISLVLSDVIGDPLDIIASGPTVPDPGTFSEALAIIRQLDVRGNLPATVIDRLERGARGLEPETPKPGDPLFERCSTLIVANNGEALRAARMVAEQQGWTVLSLGGYLEGEAREVGSVLGAIARASALEGHPAPPPLCLVAGGETVVTVRGEGRGGRNQELALGAARAIAGLADVLVASLGTDGTDGPTEVAGALVDGATIERAQGHGLDPNQALLENDTTPFFEALGDALVTGPTRTNVNDLMCVLVGVPSEIS